MPLIRAEGSRATCQAREPGQIVFHHRPEGHLPVHVSVPTADSTEAVTAKPARATYSGCAASASASPPTPELAARLLSPPGALAPGIG